MQPETISLKLTKRRTGVCGTGFLDGLDMSGFLDDIPEVELPPVRSKRLHRIREAGPKKRMAVINTGNGVRTVIWHVIKCPECGSTKVPVQHTDRPIRHHKCANCGETFKSVEQ